MLKRFHLDNNETVGWHVDLPTYRMVAGSFLPLVTDVIGPHGIAHGNANDILSKHTPSVMVELPEDTPVLATGDLDVDGLRRRYRGHGRYGQTSWMPPKEVKGGG